MIRQSIRMPSVAVCLAAYNGVNWLREQLDSILAQDGVEVTVFVSVDFSLDGTEQMIDAAAEIDSRIVVLPHGQRFGGAARNFFRILYDVDFSKFDYVGFSDQDDIWYPDKMIRAHQAVLHKNANAYSSNVLAFWSSGRRMLIRKSQHQKRWDFLFEAAGPGCTYVLQRELALKIQALLRARWQEVQAIGLHDWFIYAFARANGYRWVIDDYAGMLYRQHESNQVGVNSGVRAFFQRARKVLNGWGLIQAALIAQLIGLGDDSFVKRWAGGRRVGLLWLAFHAWQCRRRVRDQIIFSLSCIALCLVRSRHQ